MIVQCKICRMYLEDEFRSVLCPHTAFAANDGSNNFSVHDDAYLSDRPPKEYIPDGYYFKDDLDGGRLVKK